MLSCSDKRTQLQLGLFILVHQLVEIQRSEEMLRLRLAGISMRVQRDQGGDSLVGTDLHR